MKELLVNICKKFPVPVDVHIKEASVSEECISHEQELLSATKGHEGAFNCVYRAATA